jgi:hypothetical protein
MSRPPYQQSTESSGSITGEEFFRSKGDSVLDLTKGRAVQAVLNCLLFSPKLLVHDKLFGMVKFFLWTRSAKHYRAQQHLEAKQYTGYIQTVLSWAWTAHRKFQVYLNSEHLKNWYRTMGSYLLFATNKLKRIYMIYYRRKIRIITVYLYNP